MSMIPTVVIYRDGRRMIVNDFNVPKWEAEGWSTRAPDAPSAPPAPQPPPAPPVVATVRDDGVKPAKRRRKG